MDRTYYLKHFGLPEETLRMVLSDPLPWCLLPLEFRGKNLLCDALAGVMGYTPLSADGRAETVQLSNMMAILSYLSGLTAERGSAHVGMISIGYGLDATRKKLLSAGRPRESDCPRETVLTFGVPADFKELRAIPSCRYEGTSLVRGVSAPGRHRGETIHSDAAFGVTYENLVAHLREQSGLQRDILSNALGPGYRSKLSLALQRMPSTAGLVLLQVPIVSLAPAIAERADYAALITATRQQSSDLASRASAWRDRLLQERQRMQDAYAR